MKNLSERFADLVAAVSCSSRAFFVACLIVLIWVMSGPHFGYSDTWQLVINTGTTIVTFLMIFLVGNSQQRADASRGRLMLMMEDHIEQMDQHMQQTNALIAELHTMNRRQMVHFGLHEDKA